MRLHSHIQSLVARGSHRNVLCTSSCDGDQSEIKGSSTQASNDQGIKMAFRPQIRSNQNKMPDVVCTMHTLLTLMLHRAIVVISTVLCPVARILLISTSINNASAIGWFHVASSPGSSQFFNVAR